MPPKELLSCHHCMTIQSTSATNCEFCHARLHPHIAYSLQRSWNFLITSILLYLPANLLPIMSTNQLGKEVSSTIVGGVILLWEHGSYFIAGIIFIASILVPIGKFMALFLLCAGESLNLPIRAQNKTKIYRITEFVGRWSMVDVFVVAFLAGLIQMGELMSIYPGPAAIAFAGMVILTMLAANSIDPKMFWDNHNE
jgi:paraquat-inducible protein A